MNDARENRALGQEFLSEDNGATLHCDECSQQVRSNEAHSCPGAAPRPVALSRRDWEEIYAALLSKQRQVEQGEYGTDDDEADDGVSVKEWSAHLRQIMDTIGPDGHAAAERGVTA